MTVKHSETMHALPLVMAYNGRTTEITILEFAEQRSLRGKGGARKRTVNVSREAKGSRHALTREL